MANKIPFDGTTNYPDVLRVTKLMFGDVVAQGSKCCHTPQVESALGKAERWIAAADRAVLPTDVIRYQDFVKSAYLTLYPFSGDKDYTP